MAEHIEKAYKIQYINQSFTYDEKAAEKALCGISRIWVSTSMRRNKIATKLLDCARMNFLYFRVLELNEIAFSDPTQLGQAFAKSYLQNEHFLVYNSTRD